MTPGLRNAMILTTAICGLLLAGCYNAMTPNEVSLIDPGLHLDRSIPIAALDYQVGDLHDPAELAKLARADILILGAWQFWETPADLALIRQANPDIRILAYFSVKDIQLPWAEVAPGKYTRRLYDAALPYLVHTVTGDTVSDWYGAYVYDFTNPDARSAMLDIFEEFQTTSGNRFDGVFWDYFSPTLWVPQDIKDVTGDADFDGDGIGHWDDPDEIDSFLLGQEAWIDEMRVRMGEDFIQVANGVRALVDSTFAAKVDGMFYEDFPAQGFYGGPPFQLALDANQFNNLWAAHSWPRTRNGGPWLILSHFRTAGYYWGPAPDYAPMPIDADDLTRIVAMMTDATAIAYDESGERSAGMPMREYNLGVPLGGVTVNYPHYTRQFTNGTVELTMRSGAYPYPFDYTVYQDGQLIDESPYPAAP